MTKNLGLLQVVAAVEPETKKKLAAANIKRVKETHISTGVMTQFHSCSDVQKTHLTRTDS